MHALSTLDSLLADDRRTSRLPGFQAGGTRANGCWAEEVLKLVKGNSKIDGAKGGR
jgi:hypothetical protein